MADIDNTQNGPMGPILADDLMRDRSRQFTEFLDDQVSQGCTYDYTVHESGAREGDADSL